MDNIVDKLLLVVDKLLVEHNKLVDYNKHMDMVDNKHKNTKKVSLLIKLF